MTRENIINRLHLRQTIATEVLVNKLMDLMEQYDRSNVMTDVIRSIMDDVLEIQTLSDLYVYYITSKDLPLVGYNHLEKASRSVQ